MSILSEVSLLNFLRSLENTDWQTYENLGRAIRPQKKIPDCISEPLPKDENGDLCVLVVDAVFWNSQCPERPPHIWETCAVPTNTISCGLAGRCPQPLTPEAQQYIVKGFLDLCQCCSHLFEKHGFVLVWKPIGDTSGFDVEVLCRFCHRPKDLQKLQ